MKAKGFLSTVLSICLAVLMLFSFVGCGEKDPVKEALSTGEKIPYIDRTMVFKDKIFGFKNEIVKVVRSRAELVSAIHEANFSWKKETETWSEYNDDFFQYSALIVCLQYMEKILKEAKPVRLSPFSQNPCLSIFFYINLLQDQSSFLLNKLLVIY